MNRTNLFKSDNFRMSCILAITFLIAVSTVVAGLSVEPNNRLASLKQHFSSQHR